MLGSSDVEDIIVMLLSCDYIGKWEKFISDNEHTFSDGCSDCDYSHPQYALFERFSSLVDDQIKECCTKVGYSTSSFHQACRDSMDGPNKGNDAAGIFCTLVVASTEFETFADIMSDKNKKKYFFQILESWRISLHKQRK